MADQKIDIIVQAQDQATAVLKKIQSGISGIPTSAKLASAKFSESFATMKTKAEAMQGTFTKIGLVGGVAFAGVTSGLKGAINDASALNSSLVGLKSIVEGTGGDFEKAKKVIQNFTKDGLVSTSEAATSLKNLMAKGFSLDQAAEMMDRFKDSASFGRQAALGLGEAIAGATEGIKNENSMLVDNAGVTKNVSVMLAEYAKAHGVAVTALTNSQKNEAVYQGIMQETKFQVGDAAKYSEEYAGKVAKLDAAKLQLSQTIGQLLLPTMAKVIATIQPAIEATMKWTQENPKLAQAIIIGTVAVAGLTVAIGVLGLALPAIITGFSGFMVATRALGTALMFLAANPIGLVITAIALLAGAVYAVYTNWDAIRPKLLEVWETIKTSITGVVDAIEKYIVGKFTAIAASVTGFLDKIKNAAAQVRDYVNSILDQAKRIGENFSISGAVTAVSETISGKRAFGGPVEAGKTYQVGERGMEYFVPSQNGSIVPNNQIGGAVSVIMNLGGVTVRNDGDIALLTASLKDMFIREMKLQKLASS